jgi:hypothetical protein
MDHWDGGVDSEFSLHGCFLYGVFHSELASSKVGILSKFVWNLKPRLSFIFPFSSFKLSPAIRLSNLTLIWSSGSFAVPLVSSSSSAHLDKNYFSLELFLKYSALSLPIFPFSRNSAIYLAP